MIVQKFYATKISTPVTNNVLQQGKHYYQPSYAEYYIVRDVGTLQWELACMYICVYVCVCSSRSALLS